MLHHLQTSTPITEKIHQQAALAHLGAPLQAYKGTFLRLISVFCLLISTLSALWFCYTLYAYFAFISLAHTYPTFLAIPPHLLDHYLWLEMLHDSFWRYSVMDVGLILTSLPAFFFSLTGFNTKIYIYTHGLLKIEKKKVETIHWNQVEKLHTSRGNVTLLLRQDNTRFTIDDLFYRQPSNRNRSTFIANAVSRTHLPQLLEQFDHGGTISIGTLQASKKGLYRLDLLLPWKDINAVSLRKGHLYVFAYQIQHVFAKKEYTWAEWINDSALPLDSIDLPLFTALISAIIEQKSNTQIEHQGKHLS